MIFATYGSYFVALVAIAIAPGPILLLLMTRAASNDVRGAIGFAVGTALGSLTIVTAVCYGLAAWMSSVPQVLAYSKYVMLAYILWIARDMWRNGFDMSGTVAPVRSGLGLALAAGFTTCVLSPYTLVLFPLILPEVMDLTVIEMPTFLIVALVTLAAELTAAGLIVALAAQLRRLTRSPRSVMVMNRGLASVLVLGGGWMALA